MKAITDPDGQSLLFAIAPPVVPMPAPTPKAQAEGKAVTAAASSPKAVKKAANKKQVSHTATVKQVLPEPIEVKPWEQAEIQITATLMPVDADPSGRQVIFTIKTDGMPPIVKLLRIADSAVWPRPQAELIQDYEEQIRQEIAKRNAKAVNTDNEAGPEPITEEAVAPTAEAEAELVETAEDNPTPGETDGQDSDA